MGCQGKDVGKWVKILEERFKVEEDGEVLEPLGEALGEGYQKGASVNVDEDTIKRMLKNSYSKIRYGAIKILQGVIESGNDVDGKMGKLLRARMASITAGFEKEKDEGVLKALGEALFIDSVKNNDVDEFLKLNERNLDMKVGAFEALDKMKVQVEEVTVESVSGAQESASEQAEEQTEEQKKLFDVYDKLLNNP